MTNLRVLPNAQDYYFNGEFIFGLEGNVTKKYDSNFNGQVVLYGGYCIKLFNNKYAIIKNQSFKIKG